MKKKYLLFLFIVQAALYAEITPPKESFVDNPTQTYVEADFIYWIAKEEGLNYALSGIAGNNLTTIDKGKVHQPGTRFSPGFKAGISLGLPHDDWIISAQYSWIKNGYKQSNSKNLANSTMQSLWIYNPDDFFPTTNLASGKWKIQHNTVTLNLKRNSMLSDFMGNNISIGLIGAWNTQDYLVNYNDLIDNEISTTTTFQALQHFYGVGIQINNETEFYLTQNWRFFGNLTLSELLSHFNTTSKFRRPTEENNPILAFYSQNDQILSPMLAWSLGLIWETETTHEAFSFLFKIAWEQQMWMNQNHIPNLFPSQSSNLSFQGLNIKLMLEF